MRKTKKLKFIIAMIIIMVSIVIGTYKIVSADIGKNDDITNLSVGNLYNSGNLYCVEPGQVMDYNITYYRRTIITINGNGVSFRQQTANGSGTITNSNYKSGNGTSGDHNNILAAILFNRGGYGSNQDNKTGTQVAVEQYFSTWVSKSGAGSYGVEKYGSSPGSNSVLEDAKESSKEYEYSVTIHYLEHVLHKKQALIAVYDTSRTPKVPPTVNITTSKIWDDNNNAYNTRPSSVQVRLYQNGNATNNIATLSGPTWSHTFANMPGGYTYSVREVNTPAGYDVSYSGNTITNKLQTTSLKATKVWNDDNNRDGIRPTSVNVILYQNGNQFKNAILNAGNSWTHTFTGLPKYVNGSEATYTVNEETTPDGYTTTVNGGTITNTHIPEEIEINTKKDWQDLYKQYANFDELRPDSIIVKLLADGTDTGLRVTLNQNNNWTDTFRSTASTKIYKYKHTRKLITYTTQEIAYTKDGTQYTIGTSGITGYGVGTIGTNDNGYKITNTHTPHYDGYVEIKGTVWIDGAPGKGSALNGVLDTTGDIKDKRLKDVKVRLYDKNGKQIKSTYTDENGKFTRNDYAKTDENGEYTIRVNYDNSYNAYKLYENSETIKNTLKDGAYVEFEYDGMLYTTVRTVATGDNTSKAKENETTRNNIDNKYYVVDSNTPILTKEDINDSYWDDRKITASTKNVIPFNIGEPTKTSSEIIKYCNGNGKYDRTRYDNSTIVDTNKIHTCTNCDGTGHTKDEWKYDVDVIEVNSINLGLFEREQPDVAIFSDLTKVEVEMNNQKYTYLYGVRNNNPDTPEGLKVKFQNKNTYTYRRPVNPADIAYIQEETNSNKMSVKVTYEIKVANLSSTLKTAVHKIANYFDNNYTLNTDGWTETTSGGNFKKVEKDNLNIILDPLSQSDPIELTYTVNTDTIKGLINQEATLNNAVEIEKYSTYYGATTIYAEEGIGVRTGKAYAGYDFNSHPGDANIRLKTGSDGVERLYSTDINGNIITIDKLQDDTDIAPSFVLVAENPKTLAGTVWEDVDANLTDDERLGNGKIDNDEKQVQNVKVELYNLDGSLATLYSIDGATKTSKTNEARAYTGSNGHYQLEGVVTGEYYLKFTYGDDTTELERGAITIDGGETTVNARNYKSTIITDGTVKNILSKDYASFSEAEKKWHITHTPEYSVAVDNMLDRLDIPDLQYTNFKDGYVEPQNMTAYTKPFKTQIEFEASGQSNVDESGNISGVTNVLNRLDFGISERPRESLYSQKTVSYIKLRLANGQVLTEGDPRTQDLSYVKAMGFGQTINNGAQARAAIEKQLLIEIDPELIQGSQLEIYYEVTVTNDNEKDYDYGTKEDYTDIIGNNYITKSSKANYYYYGNSSGLEEMKAAIEFVDYLNSNIVYDEDANTDWKYKAISDLKDENGNKLVSAEVESFITKNDYRVLVSNVEGSIDGKVTLARGESLDDILGRPLKMSVSKLLSNQAENVYDNGIEIIKIDGKTARTIQESQNGKQIEKEYKPGNYIPNVLSEKLEQDDDRVKVIITPPTGITNYITTYIITGLVGALIVIVGIVFIKKKVLTK